MKWIRVHRHLFILSYMHINENTKSLKSHYWESKLYWNNPKKANTHFSIQSAKKVSLNFFSYRWREMSHINVNWASLWISRLCVNESSSSFPALSIFLVSHALLVSTVTFLSSYVMLLCDTLTHKLHSAEYVCLNACSHAVKNKKGDKLLKDVVELK